MSELASQLGLTSGGTTRLVDRVVTAGLVARESCPSDRRVQWVVLSPAGERKLDEALAVHLQDLQREVFDRLEPDELAALERALDKLRAPRRAPAADRAVPTAVPTPRAVDVCGSVVGVYEYGDPAGAPVMVFHGTPACGAGFAWADAPARARGLRLIAPDRPGVGLSSRIRRRGPIADYPAQVAALADALGHRAVRGRGATRAAGRTRSRARALLAERVTIDRRRRRHGPGRSLGDDRRVREDRPPDARASPRRTRRSRALLLGTSGYGARISPKLAMKSFEKQLQRRATGRSSLTLGPPDEVMALFTQAFLRGAHGVVADYAAIAQPWGFDVGAITTPLADLPRRRGHDGPAAPQRGARPAGPGLELTVWPGAGHLGTVTHVDDILDGSV